MFDRLKSILRRVARPPLHKPEVVLDYTFLGTDYGGWPLLDRQTVGSPLVYAFGVGEDISFDLGAIHRFGARVMAFDPTPRCGVWISQQTLPAGFAFHPIGLADHDGEAQFFAPEKAVNVSFSSQPAKLSDPQLAVTAPVKRLETIVSELGGGAPDVVKMDIEGFEYGVLRDLAAGALRPGQLLIEFHHGMYGIDNDRTREAVEDLRRIGYRLFYVSDSGHEYGFVHASLLQ